MFARGAPLQVDRSLWGQRGNDFETHRRRVNSLLPMRGKEILIASCGIGRDILSWLSYQPRLLVGIDLLNYERAWRMVQHDAEQRFPGAAWACRCSGCFIGRVFHGGW